MNIDIVNKQVSEKLGVPEKKVVLINTYFWRCVYDHFYGYDSRPLNIENIGVFYQDKWLIKKQLKKYIGRLKTIRNSIKFKKSSSQRTIYINTYQTIVRKLLKLRRTHKFTN
jgi:hypothetical protein